MKIDKSFVDRIGAQPHDSTVVLTAAVAMGHGLGLEVVAEGVEDARQAAFLRGIGCDLLQGYLYGRPQTADDLTPQLGTVVAPGLLAEAPLVPEQPRKVLVPAVMPSLERPARR
jgi:EAL domain-containing protein (putative c-di-GMP-specific phosphodiesterase class I)